MKNIRIEEVGDINFDFPYLEVFSKNDSTPFLEIAISNNKTLSFKIYSLKESILLSEKEWENILFVAKEFLVKAIKNENDYSRFENSSE